MKECLRARLTFHAGTQVDLGASSRFFVPMLTEDGDPGNSIGCGFIARPYSSPVEATSMAGLARMQVRIIN
jgi:hypothetical protein